MTLSPWAQSNDVPHETTDHHQHQRHQEDRLSQVNQLMALSVWGNSQVSAYLYNVMDDFPDIDPHRHLYSSFSFRTIHDLAINTVTKAVKNKTCTATDLNIIVEGLIGGTPADEKFGEAAIKKCLSSTHNKRHEYNQNNEWPCADHDAQYIAALYADIMHFAADILEPLPNQYGYIHHSMVRTLASKSDNVVASLKAGATAQDAFEPRELGQHDNFIQDGYRRLNEHLENQLLKLRALAHNTRPQPSEDFAMIAMDIESAGAYLTTLHDGLSELCAAHEWVGVYEHLAYHNMQNHTADTIPPIGSNCGIHAYLDDFIKANANVEIHPMDARVLAAIFTEIKQTHPTPRPPQ